MLYILTQKLKYKSLYKKAHFINIYILVFFEAIRNIRAYKFS